MHRRIKLFEFDNLQMWDSQYKHLLSMSNQIIRFFNQTADIYERDMLDMANKSILFGSADQNHNGKFYFTFYF